MMFWMALVKTSKWNIFFCISILIISLFLLFLNQITKIALHKYAFLCIVLLGSLSVFCQPICNIPDENAHLARVEYLMEGNFLVDKELQEFDTIQSVTDIISETKIPFNKSTLKGEKIDYTPTQYIHIAASNPSIEYIPQAVGVFFAVALGLDALWMMWLGRLTNLFFYGILVCKGIKLAPYKEILFFIALLPMSIQQAASLSPDAMINGLAIFTIGYFMYWFNKEKIRKKNLLFFGLLCILTTICKVTNIFFAGLILLLPSVEGQSKKKDLIYKIGILIIVGAIGVAYYHYTTQFAPGLWNQEYRLQNNVDSIQQIHYIINNFSIWIKAFVKSIIVQMPTYLELLNAFGWFDLVCPVLGPVMIFWYARCCFKYKSSMKYFEKIYVFLLFCGIYFLTNFALYLTWTSVGSTSIAGVQGRYFIPAIVLVSLCFCTSDSLENSTIECKEKNVEDQKYSIWVSILLVAYYLFSVVEFYYK